MAKHRLLEISMQIEHLKEELRKLPLETLQSLFDEIVTQKR